MATACLLKGSVANELAVLRPSGGGLTDVEVEHPTGFFTVSLDVDDVDGVPVVKTAALLRTARLLMTGQVFVPSSVWDPS